MQKSKEEFLMRWIVFSSLVIFAPTFWYYVIIGMIIPLLPMAKMIFGIVLKNLILLNFSDLLFNLVFLATFMFYITLFYFISKWCVRRVYQFEDIWFKRTLIFLIILLPIVISFFPVFYTIAWNNSDGPYNIFEVYHLNSYEKMD